MKKHENIILAIIASITLIAITYIMSLPVGTDRYNYNGKCNDCVKYGDTITISKNNMIYCRYVTIKKVNYNE